MSKYDRDKLEIFVGGGISFVVKFLGGLLTYISTIYITRFYGLEMAGAYFYIVSIIYILAGLSSLGMEHILIKLIPIHVSNNNFSSVKDIFNRVLLKTLTVGSIFILGLLILRPYISPISYTPFFILALTVISLALANILAASLQGLKRISASGVTSSLLLPLLTIIFIWMLGDRSSFLSLAISFASASYITIAVAYFIWISVTNNDSGISDVAEWIAFDKSRVSFFIISVMNLVIVWLPNVILGTFGDEGQVAIYNAALRSAMMLSIVHISVSAIIAPKYSELFSSKNYAALDKSIRFSVLLMISISSVPLIFIIVFSESIINLFGDSLDGGQEILVVLAVGQFINVAASSFYHFNLMTGNEVVVRRGLVIATLTGSIFGAVGMSYFGAIAMAYGSLISIILLSASNFSTYLDNRRKFGVYG